MKLSILICSLNSRFDSLKLLTDALFAQIGDSKDVEVIWLGDNKKMSVGEKRNKLISLARGEYISFIDDDDMISEDYVSEILKAMTTQPVAIAFSCQYENKETGTKEPVYFSKANLNVNEKGYRLRMINHLCAIRSDIVRKVPFKEISFCEDTDFAIRLRNDQHLAGKHEVIIPKILYYYQFDPHKSETWSLNAMKQVSQKEVPIKLDVIIISDGTTLKLKTITQAAIDSVSSESSNVVVLEKSNHKYLKADTIIQYGDFNYNKFLNAGANFGNAKYICFSNNDVIFPENFVNNIFDFMEKSKIDVASFDNQTNLRNSIGLSGFCFVMTRESWNKIGKLNEDYKFWCADNVVGEQIKNNNLKSEYAPIKVQHLVSTSLKELSKEMHDDYTKKCVQKFNKNYNQNILGMGVET